MTTHAGEALVSWAEIQDIELVIVRRMREYASGAHPSSFQGSGHDFVGLRDWQAGDRLSSIDWAQSSLTNFSPIVTREFEQQSSARVVIVADTSLSTRCGVDGVPIATVIARTVGTLALAGAFFQDQVGLIMLDGRRRELVVRPQIGRNHAIHCLDAYQDQVLGARGESAASHRDRRGARMTRRDEGEYRAYLTEAQRRQAGCIAGRMQRDFHHGLLGRRGGAEAREDVTLAGLLRKTSLVPVISDFLFNEPEVLLDELAELNARHDVFVVMVDSAYAFDLPPASAGWIEGYDVETGRVQMLSVGELQRLGARVETWQADVERAAQDRGLEVLRLGVDSERFHETVVEFLASRRMRKR